jgi:hypothetical protein
MILWYHLTIRRLGDHAMKCDHQQLRLSTETILKALPLPTDYPYFAELTTICFDAPASHSNHLICIMSEPASLTTQITQNPVNFLTSVPAKLVMSFSNCPDTD